MSKRLMILVLAAVVVCFMTAAYAEVQNVKVGGDLTIVGVSRNNVNQKRDSGSGGLSATGAASIARIKVDANLTDNVDVTFRLLNERAWGTLDGTGAPYNTAIDVDLAYITLKDFLKDQIGVPLTVKLGRQELKLGDGLLIGDPDTNQYTSSGNFAGTALGDLDVKKAFDSAVVIADLNPLTVIGAMVKGKEGSITNGQDDLNVFVLNGAYKMDVMNTVLELTYLLEPRNKIVYTTAGDISVYDGRVTITPIEDLNLAAEYAYQTYKDTAVRTDAGGKKKTISDTAFRLVANYTFAKVAMTPAFGLDYTRLSKTWLPLFEDITPADIMNLIFANTNAQVVGATVSAKPVKDVMLKLRYATAHAFAPLGSGTGSYTSAGTGQVYTTTLNKQMGQEVDFGVAYDYTDDVQFGLNLGYFLPGKAFDNASRGKESQVIGSMKVSF